MITDQIKESFEILEPKIVRQGHLAEKIVIVDGQPGCGKTMLSPIIASMRRVELLSYAFEIEFICRLFNLKKMEWDAAVAMVRMLTDHKLYQTMMGRDTNFRYFDLSSAFQDANPWRYLKRIFQEGDQVVTDRILNERPILHLTTHDLLSVSEPIMEGLGNRVVFIEMVRHPLYMIKQQQVNMESLLKDPRDIQIYIEYNKKQIPYFANGWEDQFLSANSMEKAIYTIEHLTKINERQRKQWNEHKPENIVTVPFEKFVPDPWSYLKTIEESLDSKVTPTTEKIMKKQKVPRTIIADGINLKLYKRYGWKPSATKNEVVELKERRDFAKKNAQKKVVEVLDRMSVDYEKEHFNEVLFDKYT